MVIEKEWKQALGKQLSIFLQILNTLIAAANLKTKTAVYM